MRIEIVISNVSHSLGLQMLADGLDTSKVKFTLLQSVDSHLENYLREQGFEVERFPIASTWDKIRTIVKMGSRWLINRPSHVHCNNRLAYLTCIPLAWVMRIKHRIYTRHHATLQHQYYPDKVYQDKLTNRLCTKVVSISENVTQTLIELEGLSPDKIVVIPHGFDRHPKDQLIEQKLMEMKKRLGISDQPVIGVISRLTELKGVSYVVDAFAELLAFYPDTVLILANAYGPKRESIETRLQSIPSDNYRMIEYEQDVITLYHLMDLFVHVPINKSIEAFGQTYIEALATGTPSIFTLSGVASEFAVHGMNCHVVDYEQSHEILVGMKKILDEPSYGRTLVENGLKVVDRYSRKRFQDGFARLYSDSIPEQ